jgi:hypothetical protein
LSRTTTRATTASRMLPTEITRRRMSGPAAAEGHGAGR